MVLNKILDKFLSSYQICFKSIKGFRNYEILKALTENSKVKFLNLICDLDL